MATYTIRPVNMDLVQEHEPDIADAVVPYGEHKFDEIEWTRNYAGEIYPMSGIVHLSTGGQYRVFAPCRKGFVVQKAYKMDMSESDEVLREWGDYNEYNMWDCNDKRLQDWLQNQVSNVIDYNHHTCKPTYRLRAFGPRRSEKFVGKITLWQSQKNRDDDRLTAMKPARAIKLMFPELDHKSLITISDAYLQEFAPRDLTLHTSKDADEFAFAYSGEQSPTENVRTTPGRKSMACSCMRYEFDHLSAHPATAYASGDFTIIYTTDQNNLVASRCVVYYKEGQPRQAGPVYGVSEQAIDMIEEYLHKLKVTLYENGACWIGARLQRIEEEGGFLAPYLDLTPQSLTDTGDYLEVHRRGEIDASQYNGILGGHYTSCHECGEHLSEDDYYYSEYNNNHYCESCFYDEHLYCDYWQETVHQDETIVCWRVGYNGQHESVRVYERIVHDGDVFVECSDNEYWHIDDAVFCESQQEFISPDDIGDYFTSDWDGELYPDDQMCRLENGDAVSREELDNDHNVWQKNEDDVWEQVQEELELDA